LRTESPWGGWWNTVPIPKPLSGGLSPPFPRKKILQLQISKQGNLRGDPYLRMKLTSLSGIVKDTSLASWRTLEHAAMTCEQGRCKVMKDIEKLDRSNVRHLGNSFWKCGNFGIFVWKSGQKASLWWPAWATIPLRYLIHTVLGVYLHLSNILYIIY
jgi:hypothetical protein